MAERNLSPEVIALIQAGVIEPAVFFYADFPSGVRRLWTGAGNYTDDESNVWQGIGGIINIEGVDESIDTAARGIKISISGLDTALVTSVLEEAYQGRRAEMRLGFWNRALNTVVFTDEPVWKGTLDTDESTITGKSTQLTMFCEHRMVDILRKRELRYTDRDQQFLNPGEGDTGLSHIEAIMDKTIAWGRTQQ